ncbi:hypothetical protein ACT6QG_05250 [Xanthobacter sp. TB0136]|uniref:hypothetical protein n=1 Tax=Xanthobacter sp. TB0136 TaxID=3459177 RepID=UPI00403917BA
MADPVKDYTILTSGFLFGDWHEAGGTIKLTEKQARMFVNEGRLAEPKPEVKRAPSKAKAE